MTAVALTPLGRARRVLSGVVCISALALVMAKTGTPGPHAEGIGMISAFCFVVALIALVEIARREHAEAEHASAERERRQLAMMTVQLELAKAKLRPAAAPSPSVEEDPG
ncbi:MAG: hypothetical protein ABI895_06925 [Deltaproteobacteria bacterium]